MKKIKLNLIKDPNPLQKFLEGMKIKRLEPKSSTIIVRVTDFEKKLIGEMARDFNASTSEFIRHAIMVFADLSFSKPEMKELPWHQKKSLKK